LLHPYTNVPYHSDGISRRIALADGQLRRIKLTFNDVKFCEIFDTRRPTVLRMMMIMVIDVLLFFVAVAILMSPCIHDGRLVKAGSRMAPKLYRILLLVCSCRSPFGFLIQYSRSLFCVYSKSVGGGGCVKVGQGGAMLWRGRVATLCSKLAAPLDGCVVGVNN
jgi:hypothetical protein